MVSSSSSRSNEGQGASPPALHPPVVSRSAAELYRDSWQNLQNRLRYDPDGTIRQSRYAMDDLILKAKATGVKAREVELYEQAKIKSNFAGIAAAVFSLTFQTLRARQLGRPRPTYLRLFLVSGAAAVATQMFTMAYVVMPKSSKELLSIENSPVAEGWCKVLKEELGDCMQNNECKDLMVQSTMPRFAATCYEVCAEKDNAIQVRNMVADDLAQAQRSMTDKAKKVADKGGNYMTSADRAIADNSSRKSWWEWLTGK